MTMPALPQRRHLVTAIPGPRSVALTAAGGGVVVEVDGNSLIDLGSGIAVTTP